MSSGYARWSALLTTAVDGWHWLWTPKPADEAPELVRQSVVEFRGLGSSPENQTPRTLWTRRGPANPSPSNLCRWRRQRTTASGAVCTGVAQAPERLIMPNVCPFGPTNPPLRSLGDSRRGSVKIADQAGARGAAAREGLFRGGP